MPPLLPGNFLVSMLGWENAGQWKSNPSRKNSDSVIKTEKYKQYAWGGGGSWGLECPPSAVTGWGECWLICEASCSKQIPVWLFEQASCASQSPCHMPAIIHNFTMKTNTANEKSSLTDWLWHLTFQWRQANVNKKQIKQHKTNMQMAGIWQPVFRRGFLL